MFALLVVVLCINLLYIYVTYENDYWKKRNVFHMKPLPFVGNFLSVFLLKKNMGQFTADVYREHRDQPYVGMYMGLKPGLIINDMSLADHIMKDFQHFSSLVFTADPRTEPLMGKNLVSIEGQEWKLARSKLSQGFTSVKLKAIFDDMVLVSKNFQRKINSEPSFDVVDLCGRYTSDLISRGVFGINGEALDNPDTDQMRHILNELFSNSPLTAFKIGLTFISPSLLGFLNIKILGEHIYEFVSKFTQSLENDKNTNKIWRNDYMDMLLEQKKKGGWERSDGSFFKLEGVNMESQLSIFFFANYETVSSTFSSIIFELAKDQDAQNNVRKEIHQVLVANKDELTFECLKDMKYLDMVINETLRIRPAFPIVDRLCTEECILPGTNIKLRKGTPILLPMRAYHMDEQYWTNPEKFDPERFRDPESLTGKPYFPFSGGPRICIGQRLAICQLKLGIIAAFKDHVLTTKNTDYTIDQKRFNIFPIETITVEVTKKLK